MPIDLQSVYGLSSRTLTDIGKLAPLSVVIAALGFLNTLRQNRAARRREEASKAREVINRFGAKAYLLNWSLVGKSDISVGALKMRELIEERLGKTPQPEALAAFVDDQLLFESTVEQAWRESGVIARFQQEALEFGRIRAETGNRVLLVQKALETVETRLRLLFLLNTLVVFSIRNDAAYHNLAEASPEEGRQPMTELHHLLFRAAQFPDKGVFQEACKLLEEFSAVAGSASDKRILGLMRQRPPLARRIGEYFRNRQEARSAERSRQDVIRRLRERSGAEAPLLSQAAEKVFEQAREARMAGRDLRTSAERIVHAFAGAGGSEKLEEATSAFVAAYSAEDDKDRGTILRLLELRASGVDDPDIDLFLATSTGLTELLKSALNRGGHPNVNLNEVLARHAEKPNPTADVGHLPQPDPSAASPM